MMITKEHVLYFIIYGFLGWIYESLYYSILFKKRINTGFLKGCFCPIYGLVCLLNVVFFSNETSNLRIFFLSMLSVSFIEYIVSWTLEKIFHKRWWDYSELPFNINGRISFFSSLAFGILSFIQLKIIHPAVISLIKAVDERVVHIFIVTASVVIIFDVLRTLFDMKNSDDERLWFVNEEAPGMQKAIVKFNEKTNKISGKCNDVYVRIKKKIGK